jgi:hypothetical protein
MAEKQTFRELIRRVRAGEEQAAAELVWRYEPAIRRAVRVRLRGPRLRLTGAIVASLRFSDLYRTQAPHRLEVFEEKELPGNFPEPDLAGVCGADGLGKRPEAERPAWQKLGEEVESLRRRPGVASRLALHGRQP